MSATFDPIENAPIKVSVALNVLLGLSIAVLLAAQDTPSPGSRVRAVTPAVVNPDAVAHAGKFRYHAPSGTEARIRVKRGAAQASGVPTAPLADPVSSASKARFLVTRQNAR